MTYNKILRIDIMIDLNNTIEKSDNEIISMVIDKIRNIKIQNTESKKENRVVIMTKNDHVIDHDQFFNNQISKLMHNVKGLND